MSVCSAGLIAATVLDSIVWAAVLAYGLHVLWSFHKYDVVLKKMSNASSVQEHNRAQKAQRMADRKAKLAGSSSSAEPDAENGEGAQQQAAEGSEPAAEAPKKGWRSIFS